MPTIGVEKGAFLAGIGRDAEKVTIEELENLFFDLGLELDDIEEEAGKTTYKIDIPANRYDLLCIEGLVRAIRIFEGQQAADYSLVDPADGKLQKIIITPDVADVRPIVMGAVLRNVTFTEASYESFIDLQDKLHQNLARRRTLASIGTHDLDTVKGPFKYVARAPTDINFVALKQEKKMTAVELMELYEKDNFMKQFVPIIKEKAKYPLIVDNDDIICSLPPIINGEHSKITLKTKNVFIEVTGTDRMKTSIVLDTMVTMFSEHCATPFQIEPVLIEHANGNTEQTPELKYWEETVDPGYIRRQIGLPKEVTPNDMAKLLSKMGLQSRVEDEKIVSRVPPTRHDILHPCDIMEDVAVAYDFNKLVWTQPKTNTVGIQLPINKLCDLLRPDIAAAGYCEALTFALVSRADLGEKMGLKECPPETVHVSNPKTFEFQVCRTSLVPGLLKTCQANKKLPLPIKLFEVSDVVLKDDSKHSGSRNERHIAALHYNQTSGFEAIHGLLDRTMELLEVARVNVGEKNGYYIQAGSGACYFPGRSADVFLWGEKVGSMGVIHPNTLKAFELPNPVSVLELNLEPFL